MDSVAFFAAAVGDLPLLKVLPEIASTADLRRMRSSINGRNLLYSAAERSCLTGRLDVCRFLVEEQGFDANCTSAEGETAIFAATATNLLGAEDSVVPVLTYFLDRGVDPAAPDAKGFTPLHNAAQYGHSDAIRLLLSEGVPVDPPIPTIMDQRR